MAHYHSQRNHRGLDNRLPCSARALLRAEEFMRRFLLHVLPSGFHRTRHYGLLANANCAYGVCVRLRSAAATVIRLENRCGFMAIVDPGFPADKYRIDPRYQFKDFLFKFHVLRDLSPVEIRCGRRELSVEFH